MPKINEIMQFRFNETTLLPNNNFIHKNSLFTIEDLESPEIFNLNQIHVIKFCDCITAGVALSINDRLSVGEMYPIVKQSLYIPFTLDVMMKLILSQSGIEIPDYNRYGTGCLFLGTKVHFVKNLKNDGIYYDRFKKDVTYYPALGFEWVTMKKGFYCAHLVAESEVQLGSLAVYF